MRTRLLLLGCSREANGERRATYHTSLAAAPVTVPTYTAADWAPAVGYSSPLAGPLRPELFFFFGFGDLGGGAGDWVRPPPP